MKVNLFIKYWDAYYAVTGSLYEAFECRTSPGNWDKFYAHALDAQNKLSELIAEARTDRANGLWDKDDGDN